MIDLVSQLRTHCDWCGNRKCVACTDLERDAADEIERLTKRIKQLEDELARANRLLTSVEDLSGAALDALRWLDPPG